MSFSYITDHGKIILALAIMHIWKSVVYTFRRPRKLADVD